MLTPFQEIMLSGYKKDMIEFVLRNPICISEALEWSLSDEEPFCWRAPWVLFNVLPVNSLELSLYLERLIHAIPTKKSGHQRELIKLINLGNVPEILQGRYIEICMSIWMELKKSPSVRYIAWITIANFCAFYPELWKELFSVSSWYYIKSLSPGIRKGIEKRIHSYSFKNEKHSQIKR